MNPLRYNKPEILNWQEFQQNIVALLKGGYRPLAYCGNSDETIMSLMGNDETHQIIAFSTPFPEDRRYPSLTVEMPVFHMFERELWEEFDITPVGHPWLKGVRFPHTRPDLQMADYPFYQSDSPSIHEVGVGPVHAGVIEPGHFRFLCEGEAVHHLEIQLGFQHRGVQSLLTRGDLQRKIHLGEAIAGDTVIGHGLAYCQLVEGMSGITPPADIQICRAIALELERIAMHLADLSALAGDIAYLSGQSFFAALRTTVINTSLSICGSRFGKRWLSPGGINYGISSELQRTIILALEKVKTQFSYAADAMFADTGCLSRFDSTGVVTTATARELNFVGMAARSAGLRRDARSSSPFYPYRDFKPVMGDNGDVFSRASLRVLEVHQSIGMLTEWLTTVGAVKPLLLPLPPVPANALAISIVEGWRGEIIHLAQTDAQAKTMFYKVYDPSFHNWTALAMAVRNNGVSDFPVCNKSFNLSYCGFDL